jgi:hypothetical protein
MMSRAKQTYIFSRNANFIILTFLFIILFFLPGRAQYQEVSVQTVFQKSDFILHVKVDSIEYEWLSDSTHIITKTRFIVLETIKSGNGQANPLTLQTRGGTVGRMTEYVSTAVRFFQGEECILFLEESPLMVTEGFSGKFSVSDGRIFVDNQKVKSSDFIEALRKSQHDQNELGRYLNKNRSEKIKETFGYGGSILKSGVNTTTNDCSIDGHITNFHGALDENDDGYYESLSFTIDINAKIESGPDSVYFKIICTSTGQEWISEDYFVIPGSESKYLSFPFNEEKFTGFLTNNKELDFTVQVWNKSQTELLAEGKIVESEPIRIGIPIPPLVTINSISPDKASAGTNTIVTISGVNFGATQGTGKVWFFYREGKPYIAAGITSWTDNQIVCDVPVDYVEGYPGSAASGSVIVSTDAGQNSNGYPFKVTFGYGGNKWANSIVNYHINENYSGLTGEGQAVKDAANTWNSINTNFKLTYSGSHSNTVASKNNLNEILWSTLTTSSVAETYIWVEDNSIVECDITFNLQFLWTTTPGYPESSFDIESIAVHELGHWLNLRDLYGSLDAEYDRMKMMYGFSSLNQNKRNLHSDDIEGIKWIYGLSPDFTISGFVKTSSGTAVPDVEMNGLPGSPRTNAQGQYTGVVPSGWSGTLTPFKTGTTYIPASKTFNNVTGNLTNQNFTATVMNSDASLSDLKVNGITVAGFSKTLLSYSVQLPFGTTIIPTVTATTSDTKASQIVLPPPTLPGTTLIQVTAENGTTKLNYSIAFTLSPPSSNASLSNLIVNGVDMNNFNKDSLNYSLVMPYGTTAVPVVTGTPEQSGANISIQPATTLPGTTLLVVTAEDGTTKRTYRVDFTIDKNHDSTLSVININGVVIPEFTKTKLQYTVNLPFGTNQVPTVTAIPTDPNASVSITNPTTVPGLTTILVTAENGIAILTYTVEFIVLAASNDATLSDLAYNGTTLPGFNPETTYYTVLLPYGTFMVPVVTASVKQSNATLSIFSAQSLPGITGVVVTAQDGTTKKTYSVDFRIAKNTDASLSDLKVLGYTIPGFTRTIFEYTFELPFGTTEIPSVEAITNDSNASTSISTATSLPGTTRILVTAADEVSKSVYTITFTVKPASSEVSLADLTINGITVHDFLPTKTAYEIELPFGTILVPIINAIPAHEGAKVTINPAVSLPGTTVVVVTAQDQTTSLSYLVNFSLGKNSDASLAQLSVDGDPLDNFDPDTLFYDYRVSEGTVVIPVVTAMANDQNAAVFISPAATLPDTTKVIVVAEDGKTTRTYSLNIRYPLAGFEQFSDFSSIKIFPNPNQGEFQVEYTGVDGSSIRISVLDLFGRIIVDQNYLLAYGPIPIVLKISQHSKGTLFVRVIDGNKVYIRKVVIE